MISTFTAFIDSNVFYGARLRSLILYFASTGLFRARWSHDVHREWVENLLKDRPDLQASDLNRTKADMDSAISDCLVEGYADLIPALTLPDENDRHILAAAIRSRASVIVTFNERDFPPEELERYGIHTKHPDAFVQDIIDMDEEACLDAIQCDLSHYKSPALSVDDYINALEKAGIPETAEFLRGVKIIFK